MAPVGPQTARTWAQVASQFINKIPFGKLTRGQAFDLACDIVNAGCVVFVLRNDLGAYGNFLRAVLVLQIPAFVAWSYKSNLK